MPDPARWSTATDEGATVPEHIERWYWIAVAAAAHPAGRLSIQGSLARS